MEAHRNRAGESAPTRCGDGPEPLARKALRWWRGAAFAGGLATAAAIGVVVYLAGEVDQRESQLAQVDGNRENLARQNVQLAAQLQAQPAIQYVAVLSDEQSAAVDPGDLRSRVTTR